MKTIDFLPTKYRDRYAARAAVIKRWTIVCGIAVLIAPLACLQNWQHHRVVTDLVAIEGQYSSAVKRAARLDELRADLELARGEAALLAYLNHPWPRTQVLARINEPLPEAVRLTSIHMLPEAVKTAEDAAGGARNRAARRANQQQESNIDDRRPAAEKDLLKLAQQNEQNDTIVVLTGITVDTTDLHKYVAKLRLSELFVKSELKSLESIAAQDTSKAQKFEIRLVMADGHAKLPKSKGTEVTPGSVAGALPPSLEVAQRP